MQPPITEALARAHKMVPVTLPAKRDSEFIQSVIRDMRRTGGTVWAVVRPENPQLADSPDFVEIWRVPLPLP